MGGVLTFPGEISLPDRLVAGLCDHGVGVPTLQSACAIASALSWQSDSVAGYG
jgi:hypothetical protein